MARILFLMMFPFMCFSQITPSEDIPVNNLLKEKENLDTKRKASYNLDEIKVRWKKAALENCPGVPCVVTPPAPSFTCPSTVTDVDGNVYNTKLIGSSQCWTTTNLKVTKYNDGILITDLSTSPDIAWDQSVIGARTGYIGVPLSDYVGTFGYLYNWRAVNDPRKLCPDGWHVPTDAEWTIMIQSLVPNEVLSVTLGSSESTSAGTVMKSTTTNTLATAGSGLGWDPATPTGPGGNNASGFSGLPGGVRINSGNFVYIRSQAYFWSAIETSDNSRAWYRDLNLNDGRVYRSNLNKSFGASVRCLKD